MMVQAVRFANKELIVCEEVFKSCHGIIACCLGGSKWGRAGDGIACGCDVLSMSILSIICTKKKKKQNQKQLVKRSLTWISLRALPIGKQMTMTMDGTLHPMDFLKDPNMHYLLLWPGCSGCCNPAHRHSCLCSNHLHSLVNCSVRFSNPILDHSHGPVQERLPPWRLDQSNATRSFFSLDSISTPSLGSIIPTTL